MMAMEWEVVAGADKGGILVRAGRDTRSPEYPQRLAFGASVRQVELHGDRLYYQKISGLGPDIGWVSTRLKDKDLLKRKVPASRAERASVRQNIQQQMQYQPHMREQFQAVVKALDAADAEEDERLGVSQAPAPRAPAAAAKSRQPAPALRAAAPKAAGNKPKDEQSLRAQRSELLRQKAQAIEDDDFEEAARVRDALKSVDAQLEQLSSAPPVAEVGQALPSMDELMQGMDDDDDEVMEAPAPAAPVRTAPVQAPRSVPARTAPAQPPAASAPAAAGEDDENYEERIPSIDELLGKIDDEEVVAPPSLEEMLKALDKDEEEQTEFEENLTAQQSFWNMGSLKESSLAERLMIEDDNKSKRGIEDLNALQHDSVPRSGTFNYNDIFAFGDLCMKRMEEVKKAKESAGEAPPVQKAEPKKDAPKEVPAKAPAEEEDEVEDLDDAAFLASLGLSADGVKS
mmetsp:Transcript_48779/g.88153  ORF Transcript_48779/g.88153 Transcript_48779/m.88153 type:complete len:458 (+) Transcript_48779:66-1439(+)